MRKNDNQEYTSPVLESINLEVEKGFAQSGDGIMSTGYALPGMAGDAESSDYGYDL